MAAKRSEEKKFQAKVFVSLKPTVNDPQGNTIAGALGSLGFSGVEAVRSGKLFTITMSAKDGEAARKAVDEMSGRLLANPVIETYSFEIEEA